ncbi:hypothetical protein EPA93_00910 [Ktedonosporobacter rubrisoli]|uniref:Protein kinase domain-containing protein n=1 Tax=Ktedonosporobacter rubrisoli TaxID=2509675 RepID=A0A4P6JHV9_KTERU|nr:hypothetical protein [Ktedonosporobacter rubrisoli]QBD74625.1 hypothetical protein EPA93_00910 [Ktedonosporobacter rubrisoli]
MKNAEMKRISALLSRAQRPGEIFGKLAGTQDQKLETARRVYRQIAKVLHPDLYTESADIEKASSAFKKLVRLWLLAQKQIEDGTYGRAANEDSFAPFDLRGQKGLYRANRLLAHGDYCALYISTAQDGPKTRSILKIPSSPRDNDLAANETRILKHLSDSKDYEQFRHFISQPVEALTYQEEASGAVRQINVLAYTSGLYSLKEVREVYPHGIDPKDMAWIWRRLLVALGFAHAHGVIHGAVLPTHILLHPSQHGVVLIDWSYAVLKPAITGERIRAISGGYRDWYPAEVFARERPMPGLDFAMAARCMIELLGGNPQIGSLAEHIPWQLQHYLKGCTLPKAEQRPQAAHLLLTEFDALIERLWGPRQFHTFVMPECQ